MNRTAAFILLVTMCYYYIISLTVVEIGLLANSKQVKSQMHVEKQIILSLTKQEYLQYRHGVSELRIKGELYDIKKIHYSENEVLVYCINDKKETMMLAELENFFGSNSAQSKSPVPNAVFKFLSLFYIPSYYDQGFKVNDGNARCFYNPSLKTISDFFPVSTPPPRSHA